MKVELTESDEERHLVKLYTVADPRFDGSLRETAPLLKPVTVEVRRADGSVEYHTWEIDEVTGEVKCTRAFTPNAGDEISFIATEPK
jgi:hypothetical protein